jgi:hypothetical protein
MFMFKLLLPILASVVNPQVVEETQTEDQVAVLEVDDAEVYEVEFIEDEEENFEAE